MPIRTGQGALAGAELLLADDSPEVLCGWDLLLRREGARTKIARSVGEALAIVRDPCINLDAALLDYLMPGGNADVIVRGLREQCKPTATLLVSGVSRPVLCSAAAQMGADRILMKPMSAQELVLEVAATIHHTRARSGATLCEKRPSVSLDDTRGACEDLYDLVRDLLRHAGVDNELHLHALDNRIRGGADVAIAELYNVAESTVRNWVAAACERLGADDVSDVMRVIVREAAAALAVHAEARGIAVAELIRLIRRVFASSPLFVAASTRDRTTPELPQQPFGSVSVSARVGSPHRARRGLVPR